MTAAVGFEAHAETYRAHWSADPVARRMREQVHSIFATRVRKGAHVLDVGCGAGCDSAWLVAQGYRVTAVDATLEMVKETEARVPEATVFQCPAERLSQLPISPDVDAVLLNFGVVNAISPSDFIREAEGLLAPTAEIFVVSMPRLHAAWLVRCGVQANFSALRLRCRSMVDVDVFGHRVVTRYWNTSELKRLWPKWSCVGSLGLGMLVPPQSRFGWLMTHAPMIWIDSAIGRWPLIWQWGDHALSIWQQKM